ncbi:MAG: ribonuclease HI family protein [Candidatus Buchananbacteria bacterium]|nr:ribonuclease HI family protein [Candidatus Buchananbacteria bacterium]
MSKAIIHTDGGARGNPGPAGIGVVIEINGQTHHFKKFIGETTNNQAEYQAVILALEKAKELGVEEIDLFLDSELVQQQLVQKYKVKNVDLAPLFVKVWNLAMGFKKVRYTHVRRADNKAADRLVNEVLDEQLKK